MRPGGGILCLSLSAGSCPACTGRSRRVNAAFDTYDFDDACAALYEFIWGSFCDWFVELSKPALQGDDAAAKAAAQSALYGVLETALRLLHPIMPFATEEIWQSLPRPAGSICIAAYPASDPSLIDLDAEAGMSLIIESITALRALRADFTPGGPENEAARAAILNRRFSVTIVPQTMLAQTTLQDQLPTLTALARLGRVELARDAPDDMRVLPIGCVRRDILHSDN